jgi:hypothetical protein
VPHKFQQVIQVEGLLQRFNAMFLKPILFLMQHLRI